MLLGVAASTLRPLHRNGTSRPEQAWPCDGDRRAEYHAKLATKRPRSLGLIARSYLKVPASESRQLVVSFCDSTHQRASTFMRFRCVQLHTRSRPCCELQRRASIRGLSREDARVGAGVSPGVCVVRGGLPLSCVAQRRVASRALTTAGEARPVLRAIASRAIATGAARALRGRARARGVRSELVGACYEMRPNDLESVQKAASLILEAELGVKRAQSLAERAVSLAPK